LPRNGWGSGTIGRSRGGPPVSSPPQPQVVRFLNVHHSAKLTYSPSSTTRRRSPRAVMRDQPESGPPTGLREAWEASASLSAVCTINASPALRQAQWVEIILLHGKGCNPSDGRAPFAIATTFGCWRSATIAVPIVRRAAEHSRLDATAAKRLRSARQLDVAWLERASCPRRPWTPGPPPGRCTTAPRPRRNSSWSR